MISSVGDDTASGVDFDRPVPNRLRMTRGEDAQRSVLS